MQKAVKTLSCQFPRCLPPHPRLLQDGMLLVGMLARPLLLFYPLPLLPNMLSQACLHLPHVGPRGKRLPGVRASPIPLCPCTLPQNGFYGFRGLRRRLAQEAVG